MATSKTIEGLYEVGPDQKLQVKQPIWKSLFFQIGVAIVLGITIGALWPAIGSQLKPIGDGFIRLIKMVIASEGQRIEIGADVRIDGLHIPQTTIVPADGRGRPLHGDVGGIVPAGRVFLYSPFVASWDSRYFGSIPAAGILGLAEEVLTYAP